MFISRLLEVAIGLMVIYYVAGLVVSFITSQVSNLFEMRGRSMYKILDEALDKNLGELLKKKMIQSVLPQTPRLVDKFRKLRGVKEDAAASLEAISSSVITLAILDEPKVNEKFTALKEILKTVPSQIEYEIKENALEFKQAAQKNIETWLDGVMQKGAGIYKENIRLVVIISAFVVAFGLNIDTVAIAEYLWNEPLARQLLSEQADEILAKSLQDGEINQQLYQAELNKVIDTTVPILWSQNNPTDNVLLKLAGLLISWAAISQGSSFWYDTLKKFKGYGGSKTASETTDAKG